MELQSSPASSQKDATHSDVKGGTVYDVKSSRNDSPPEYEDAGDGFAKVTGYAVAGIVGMVIH